ncbi:MAG: preprotein translocase subunit SecA, partial [Xanthomonadales bacterium]|nr:preprotein translocase subunit SecA [Xanthomonadales bacterium]
RDEVVDTIIDEHIPPQSMEEQWDVPSLSLALEREFGAHLDVAQWLEEEPDLDETAVRERIINTIGDEYDAKTEAVGGDLMRVIEKEYMLKFLDMHWREHLAALDYLRQGIGLRSYAQKNPKQEYKREAFEMFSSMLDRVKHELISFLARVKVRGEEDVQAAQQRAATNKMQYQHAQAAPLSAAPPPLAGQAAAPVLAGGPPVPPKPPVDPATPFVRDAPKVGRNEPCHCGSGKKFKHCHGKLS